MPFPLTIPATGSTSWATAVNQNWTTITNEVERLANKGVANGYASLDASGHVPAAQLPAAGPTIRAWVNFNGVGGATIISSFNVASVVRNAAGDYTITFATPMPDANYVVTGSARYANSGGGGTWFAQYNQAPTTSTVRVVGMGSGGYFDSAGMHVAIIG